MKTIIFYVLTLFSLQVSAVQDKIKIISSQTLHEPYLSPSVSLNVPFSLFVMSGSSVILNTTPHHVKLTLQSVEVLDVYINNEYAGNQFKFNFSAEQRSVHHSFSLVINEPQNMKLDELDQIQQPQFNVFGYQIVLLEMNFSQNRNSIELKINKNSE